MNPDSPSMLRLTRHMPGCNHSLPKRDAAVASRHDHVSPALASTKAMLMSRVVPAPKSTLATSQRTSTTLAGIARRMLYHIMHGKKQE